MKDLWGYLYLLGRGEQPCWSGGQRPNPTDSLCPLTISWNKVGEVVPTYLVDTQWPAGPGVASDVSLQ